MTSLLTASDNPELMSVLRVLTDDVANDVDEDDEIALTTIDDAEGNAPKAWRLLGSVGNAGNATFSTS